MVRFGEDASGQEASLRAGEAFEIQLAENRTTGFHWAIEKGGEPVCELVNESFDAPPGPPGRAGTHLWQFRAARAGTADFLLHYRRPWESGIKPARVFHLRVRVTE